MKTMDRRPMFRSEVPKCFAAALVMGANDIQRIWVIAATRTKADRTIQR
jgi:hypothetical protein